MSKSILNRENTDTVTAQDPDSFRVARLTGTYGETITAEAWPAYVGVPLLLVHGPKGGEKYRLAATREELVKFARDILAWKGDGPVTP